MNILSRRSIGSAFGRHLLTNPPLWMSLVISFVVVTAITGIPTIGSWFGFEALRPQDWIWPVFASVTFLACFEAKKAAGRSMLKSRAEGVDQSPTGNGGNS
jgi:hypothetical protein